MSFYSFLIPSERQGMARQGEARQDALEDKKDDMYVM